MSSHGTTHSPTIPAQSSRQESQILSEGILKRVTQIYILAFCAGFVIVAVFVGFLIRHEYRAAVVTWKARQSSIADDRSRLISDWLKERRGDAAALSADSVVLDVLSVSRPQQALSRVQSDLQSDLDQITESYGYSGIYVLDADGRLAAKSSRAETLNARIRDLCSESAEAGEFRVVTPGDKPDHPITFSMPVFAKKEPPHQAHLRRPVLGCISLLIDPASSLFPLVTRESIPTRSGETVLMRREGGAAVFISPLRNRPNHETTPFRVSFSTPRFAGRAALEGRETSGEFFDYRGVRVLAATRRIPLTGWGMVTKIDLGEALAPFRRIAWTEILAAAFLLAAFAGFLAAHHRYIVARFVKEEGEKIRDLLESVPDAILIVGNDGRIVLLNSQAETMFGYRREELVGRPFSVLAPERSRDLQSGQYAKYLAETPPHEKTFGVERQGLRKDGAEFPVEVNFGPVETSEGRFVATSIRDITERKQAEAALEESENRFRSLVENATVGIYRTTPDGRILMANPAIVRMLGYSSFQELASRNLEQEGIGVHRPRCAFKEQVDREGSVQGLESSWIRQDGSIIFVRESASVTRTADGKVLYYDGIIEDITERKHLEDQLRQAQKMEAVGRLAGGVAHDFNNLLTIITGYSQIAFERLAGDKPLRDIIEEVKKAGDRAATLTRQLLAFSRRQILQPRLLDLNSVVSNVEKMLRRLIGEDIDLVVSLEWDLGAVRADPGQIEQVIMNLAVNARDAMPSGGKLRIETSNATLDENQCRGRSGVKPGAYAVMAMTDTGCGMDEATQAHIFEPFFTTKEQGKGTGLGLATVYGIVKQSGGDIVVLSQPGQGTTMQIFLPRVEAKADEMPAEPPVAETRGHETILVVEDEASLRSLVRGILESQGYKVLDAGRGLEALEISRAYPGTIHLLLTDIITPELKGPEIAERLLPERAGMKVLFMSGYADGAVTHQKLLNTEVPFIQKPFTPRTLAHKVRQVLGPEP